MQFIDLISVTSAGTIASSYVPANVANTSGTLFISSGGTLVAAIKMAGSYSAGGLPYRLRRQQHGRDHRSGRPQRRQRSARPIRAFPRDGIDLPNIAFGAHTTLAYAANAAGTGDTLTVSDGRHAASIALLGNYVAASFVTTADGHGGTLVREAPQAAQQLILTPLNPPHA
jgi:hypothetical protein